MTNDTNTQRIISKIEKLLAMADESGGASEQERETAMRMATRLMDEHALSVADIDAAADNEDPRGLDKVTIGTALWKRDVFSTLSRLYGVHMYRMKAGRSSKAVLTGRYSARVTVMALAVWVVSSIDRQARGLPNDRTLRASFRVGAACGLADQVNAIIAERKRGETVEAPGQALVLVDHYASEYGANAALVRASGVRLSAGARSSFRSPGGYAAGKAYGSSLNLSRQVSGSSSVRRLS